MKGTEEYLLINSYLTKKLFSTSLVDLPVADIHLVQFFQQNAETQYVTPEKEFIVFLLITTKQ